MAHEIYRNDCHKRPRLGSKHNTCTSKASKTLVFLCLKHDFDTKGNQCCCILSTGPHPRDNNLSRLMSKPTKWPVRPAKTQISLGIRPVWSESSLSAWRKLGSLATHWAYNEDSDQTGRMPRLIWVFARRTCHFVGFVTRRLIQLSLIWIEEHQINLFQYLVRYNAYMYTDTNYPFLRPIALWNGLKLWRQLIAVNKIHSECLLYCLNDDNLNSVSSQCARGKTFIARNPEVHSKFA